MSEKLLTLLEIFGKLRNIRTVQDLSFFTANETYRLVPYDQAVTWRYEARKVTLLTASGNNVIEPNSPFALELQSLLEDLMKSYKPKSKQDSGEALILGAKQDRSLMLPSKAVMILKNASGKVMGGIFLQRESAFVDADQSLLEELAKAYAYALSHVRATRYKGQSVMLAMPKGVKKYVMLALLASLFIPVQLTITAPGEIVSENPVIVTMPFEGVIEDVLIAPGDEVKAGDIVATMDKSTLQSRFDLAEQELKTAQIKRARLRRESLSNPEAAAELNKLDADIKAREIEAEYAQAQLNRAEIRAEADGIAIFSDVSSLEGRPARTGMEIMTIAAPDDREVLIRIPVDSMLPISKNAGVTFYPNISPLSGYDLEIHTLGYQASPDVDGLLTYKLRARFNDPNNLRIGWSGTTKVKSDWSILAYSIMRKPLISLRRMIGI